VIGLDVAAGQTWTIIQMDTCKTANGSVVADKFCVDLADAYFVPGDTVWYFFGAQSGAPSNAWSYFSLGLPEVTNQTGDKDYCAAYPDEMTILPSLAYEGGDILYVDGMNFRGAQPYFDDAFAKMGLLDEVDRYDIRGPSSGVANHLGSRANAAQLALYKKIIWNAGDLTTAWADGSGTPDKSDDTGVIKSWIDALAVPGGVYLNGDDCSEIWNGWTSASAIALRSTYMNFSLVVNNHVPTVGVSPNGDGTGPACAGNIPHVWVCYGGCPGINDFDIIAPAGVSVLDGEYVGTAIPYVGVRAGAIVTQTGSATGNPNNRFVLSGFSFHYIRNDGPQPIPDTAEHMYNILWFLGNTPGFPIGADSPEFAKNDLGQNYPNPFNPTTTIEYQVKTSGHVSLKIYNVAGQLVRTLVDEQVKAGQVMNATWSGMDNANQPVSSGVYFYKLVTKNFTQTKKMVLLK
jgi:hypothetical protein